MINNHGWIKFDGTPVTGMVPPITTIREGNLTPIRRAMVSAVYRDFCVKKRLSIIGDAYFTGSYVLPDGTKVRIFSVRNCDYIHVWAKDGTQTFGVGVTFWCVPFDEAWIDEPFTEVFTIPRWFDINDSDANPKNNSVDFLRDLARNTLYEPPGAGKYPGNQTWFVPGTGLVVSWWGQPKRYATSERDAAVHAGYDWGRTFWPQSQVTDISSATITELDDLMHAPTGGIAGAVGEHMFDMIGADALPPGMTSAGRVPVYQSRVWLNGTPINTPANVISACVQNRSNVSYLRIMSLSGMNLSAWELAMGVDGATWELIGTFSLAPASVGLGDPTTGASGTFGYAWKADYVYLNQPFHWSADGSKAVSVAHYITNSIPNPFGGVYPLEAHGTHAILEAVVGASLAVSVIDQTTEAVSGAKQAIVTSPAPPYAYAEGDLYYLYTTTTEYSAPVAADYKGNTPTILKTHISSAGTYEQTVDATNTSYTPNGGGTAEHVTDRQTATSTVMNFQSWASLDGSVLSGTQQSRSSTQSWDQSMDFFYDENDNPDGEIAHTEESGSGSGVTSLWGFAAGDLRGRTLLLHSAPITRLPSILDTLSDSQSSFTEVGVEDTDSTDINNQTRTATVDLTIADQLVGGELVVIDTTSNTSEELTRLVSPTARGNVGTLHAVSGTPMSVTRVGTYGIGPWVELDEYSDVPLIGGSLGMTCMCPFNPLAGTNSVGNATARISINPGRSPIRQPGSFIDGAHDVVGGMGNTVLSAAAITPDLKTEYLGAVFIAMTPPGDKDAPTCYSVEKWFHDGVEFNPTYPEHDDPENPGTPVPFPHRGGHSILLDPIFTGPLP